MEKWRTISAESAARHSLYGFKGWLLVFGALQVIGLAMIARDARTTWAAMDSFYPISTIVPVIFKALWLLTQPGVSILTLVLFFMRIRGFRRWFVILNVPAIFIMAIYILALTEFYRIAHPPTYANLVAYLPKLVLPVAAGVVTVGIWFAYSLRSRRFRVNFDHQVLVGDWEARDAR